MQAPPQQDVPLPQAAPVLPQEQTPATQISSPGQTLPTEPQLLRSVWVLTQRKVPASLTQLSPTMHSKSPHMQRGAPPPGLEHALARSGSQARPQPLQFMNEGSLRPSVPAGTERFMQLVPQQRWAELHEGVHMPGGVTVESPGGTLLSPEPPTQAPREHVWPAVQVIPQPPQWVMSLAVARQKLPVSPPQHCSPAAHAGSHTGPVRPSSPQDAEVITMPAKMPIEQSAPNTRPKKAMRNIPTTP